MSDVINIYIKLHFGITSVKERLIRTPPVYVITDILAGIWKNIFGLSVMLSSNKTKQLGERTKPDILTKGKIRRWNVFNDLIIFHYWNKTQWHFKIHFVYITHCRLSIRRLVVLENKTKHHKTINSSIKPQTSYTW